MLSSLILSSSLKKLRARDYWKCSADDDSLHFETKPKPLFVYIVVTIRNVPRKLGIEKKLKYCSEKYRSKKLNQKIKIKMDMDIKTRIRLDQPKSIWPLIS